MNILKFISPLLFVALVSPLAGQTQTDMVKSIELARSEMKNSFESFFKAQNFLENANSIFASEQSLLFGKMREFERISLDFFSMKFESEKLKESIASFKIKFDSQVVNFNNARDSLAEISKSLPWGNEKIKSVNEVIDALRPTLSENPGDMYQDKNYFDRAESAFKAAVVNLKSAEDRVAATLINISVANPKIDGVAPALKLADDYMSRLEQLNTTNGERLESIRKPLEECSKKYVEASKKFLSAADSANTARKTLLSNYAALCSFMLNDVANSDKLKNCIFSRMSIFSPLNEIGFGGMNYFAGNSKPEAAFASNAAADFGISQSDKRAMQAEANFFARPASQVLQKSKDVRTKFLEKFAAIENATFEISEAARFLNTAVSRAEDENNGIDRCISTAQSLSSNAIMIFSKAQSMESKLQTASTSNKILSARNSIFNTQFDKLIDSADKQISQALEQSAKSIDSIKKLSAEIK